MNIKRQVFELLGNFQKKFNSKNIISEKDLTYKIEYNERDTKYRQSRGSAFVPKKSFSEDDNDEIESLEIPKRQLRKLGTITNVSNDYYPNQKASLSPIRRGSNMLEVPSLDYLGKSQSEIDVSHELKNQKIPK